MKKTLGAIKVRENSWNLSFNKFTGFRPATLLKKRLRHKFFPVNIAKSLRARLFIEHLRWQLLLMLFSILQHLSHEKIKQNEDFGLK